MTFLYLVKYAAAHSPQASRSQTRSPTGPGFVAARRGRGTWAAALRCARIGQPASGSEVRGRAARGLAALAGGGVSCVGGAPPPSFIRKFEV